MSSIGQSTNIELTGAEKVGFQAVELLNDSVKRGYDGKITQSHNAQMQEDNLQNPHRLDLPKSVTLTAQQLTGFKEVLSADKTMSVSSEELEKMDVANIELSPGVKAQHDNLKIMKGAQQLESITGEKLDSTQKGELLKLMAEPVPENPQSTDEAWADIFKSLNDQNEKAVSSKNKYGVADVPFTDEDISALKESKKMFDLTFNDGGLADATVKMNAITGGPKELIDEIKNDYKKIATMMRSVEDGKKLWDTDMIATMLSSIQAKMQDNRLTFDQETIKIGLEEKQRLGNQTISKLKESIKKSDEAAKSKLASKIFGWIGLAVGAVVAGLLIASGVGAVAGAFLIAGLIVSATLMIDAETGGHITAGIAKVIVSLGASEEEAQYITAAILMAITIVLAVGGGVGAAAGSASKILNVALKAASIAQGVTAVAEGASTVTTGVLKYEGSILKAETTELKAFMMRLQQALDDATESLQQALEELQNGHANIAAIMSGNDDTKKQLLSNMKGGSK